MIAYSALVAWVLALPLYQATPRPPEFAAAIAEVALADAPDDPRVLAATLDLIAAHESRYRPLARGDGGRSVGAYQTPRARTPATIAGQTRLAARILGEAARACPAHPLWAYASGRCLSSYAAREMERAVAASLAAAPELELEAGLPEM
jgi:hypothetical protein